MLEDTDYRDLQQVRDSEHLHLLGTFNFIFAGLCLFGLLPAIPMFAVMRAGGFDRVFEQIRHQMEQPGNAVPVSPEEIVAFFHVLLVAWIIVLTVSAVLCLVNGLNLRAHRHRGFSTVIAALQCLAIPFGTILGVFSLIVLGRASVTELYLGVKDGSDRPAQYARDGPTC